MQTRKTIRKSFLQVHICHYTMFTLGMSHELRNPLQALLGCLDLIGSSKGAPDKKLLITANTCGETLLNLISNILDVSKIQAGKLDLSTTAENLISSIDKVVDMCKIKAKNRNLYIHFRADKDFPEYFEFDKSKLNQVLINIISNAIKFTMNGGIWIRVKWLPVYQNNQILNRDDPLFQEFLHTSSRLLESEPAQGIILNE